MYDKGCLNEHGTLFACKSRGKEPAMLYYRPHETWTTRTDWRIPLPADEEVTAIALSENYIVCLTSANYVRIYTLFGVPISIHRQKSSPAVTCAAWRDYVLTVGNGPARADGRTQLQYSITNVRRRETHQNEDILALAPGTRLASVFFSDAGDPCVFDSAGSLLVCARWRTPGQAAWVPVLSAAGAAAQRAGAAAPDAPLWPVAVAAGRLHAIVLRAGERAPPFPRPLLSEFEFAAPLPAAPEGDDGGAGDDARALEARFVLASVAHALRADAVAHTRASHAERAELARLQIEADKVLLQLLAVECREGEERGMKALEIVGLMRDPDGRLLEAAQKVASRYGREVLRGKIAELAERRLVGLDGDEDE